MRFGMNQRWSPDANGLKNGGMNYKMKDPTVERIREVRHQISAKLNHDPKQLVAHYRKMEQGYKHRMLRDKSAKVSSPNGQLTGAIK